MPEPAFDPDPSPPPLPPAVSGATGKGDAPPAKSLDDLTDTGQYDAITKADLALTKQKIGAEGGMAAIQKRQDDAYARRQERMLAAEGSTMDDLKPWNAQQEMSKRETNLWEQFGSPGFVISMLASAFTAMPMNSALNAGAAAMNAINQGKMEDYHRAFDAWKENSKLTLKRLDIEEHEFNQIGNLRTKNMESWRSQATALAARFNDKRLQIMLENGMDAQALEAMDAKAKSKVELADATKRLEDNALEHQIAISLLGDSKDPMKFVQAKRLAEELTTPGPKTPEQEAILTAKSEPGFLDLSSAEKQKKLDEAVAGVYTARSSGRNAIPPKLQEQLDASDANAPAGESPNDARVRQNAIMSDYYKSTKNPVGAERNQITADENKIKNDLASKKITIEEAKQREDELHKNNMDAIAEGRLAGQLTAQQEKARHDQAMEEIAKTKAAGGNLTANKRADLTMLETRYQVNDDIIDEVINALKRDPSGAGLKGKVMRLEERLGNILGGTTSTKYVEIMRQIETARTLTPRLLVGASGRPLSDEAKRMDDIVPGLTIGDTWQNTIKGLQNLKETLGKEHSTLKKILGNSSAEPETPAKPAPDDWPGVPVTQ
jgi:hypothetical protein